MRVESAGACGVWVCVWVGGGGEDRGHVGGGLYACVWPRCMPYKTWLCFVCVSEHCEGAYQELTTARRQDPKLC